MLRLDVQKSRIAEAIFHNGALCDFDSGHASEQKDRMPLLNPYFLAIALTLALTVSNLIFATYTLIISGKYLDGLTFHVGLAAALAFGVWVQSKFIRYVGSVLSALVVGTTIWTMVSSGIVWSVGAVWALEITVLNAIIVYLLLFSKSFAGQFSAHSATRPTYKTTLLRAFLAIAGAAALFATIQDIRHLMQ